MADRQTAVALLFDEAELGAQLRVALEKGDQRPKQLLLAKSVRRPHPQHPHRPIVGNTQVVFQRQPGIHQLAGVTVAAFAIVSELHRMGGTQDQLDSPQPFKGLQAAADGRLGGIHLPRGGGE